MLNSPNRWGDSKRLLEYAFENYTEELAIDAEKYMYSIPVEAGSKPYVKIGCDTGISIPLSKDEKECLEYKTVVPESLQAPVFCSMQIGRFEIYCKGEEIYSIPFKALYSVNKSETKSFFKRLFGN